MTPLTAAVRLSPLFSDHVVLQREIKVPVWGWADPGEKVSVKLGDCSAQTTAGSNGQWIVRLPPMPVNCVPQTMIVTGGSTTSIQDVLIGDVWLCSGQSNMKRRLVYGKVSADKQSAQSAEFPLIRDFAVPSRSATEACRDVHGNWAVCNKQSAEQFTAVGFYFARKIHQVTGVPIGLIEASEGSTRIEVWMAPEGLAAIPELQKLRDELAGQMLQYRKELEAQLPEIEVQLRKIHQALQEGRPLPPPPEWPHHPIYSPADNGPHGYHCAYYGMICPVVPFAIKGALWYQGESNGNDGNVYYHKMRALIGGWRAVWEQGDFPFYFVQLPGYQPPTANPAGGDGWAALRQAQAKSLSIPRTGMAVAIDVGELKDVHPVNRMDIGERLALLALKNDYGKSALECSGPVLREIKNENGKIRILFDHADSGLMVGKKQGREPVQEVKDGKLPNLAVAGTNGQWFWAETVIDGKTIVASSTNIIQPTNVRYAFDGNNPQCSYLYNRDGLPAAPFSTEK